MIVEGLFYGLKIFMMGSAGCVVTKYCGTPLWAQLMHIHDTVCDYQNLFRHH